MDSHYIHRDESAQAREIDKTVKNKWTWKWLERNPYLIPLEQFIRKLDQAGMAYCTLCSTSIKYGSRGAMALEQHCQDTDHRLAEKAKMTTPTVQYASESKPYGLHPMFKNVQKPKKDSPQPLTPMFDRTTNAECKVLGFLAENNLSFNLSPKLISLSKDLAKDLKALGELSINPSSASYKTRFGLGKTVKENMFRLLQQCPFSLNIDEATSDNLLHILTVLVSFFSEELKRVVVMHLTSTSLVVVNTKSIVNFLTKFFADNEIPWKNFMSLLSDSCNVMRGCKSGVELTIRRDFAPHLLDVDGDTAHHAHNASKKISGVFEKFAEDFFFNVYNDFKWSTDLREILHELCELLDCSFTMPAMYAPTRWLSMYHVTLDVIRLWDCYIVFYYAFLSNSDKVLYLNIKVEILRRLNVSQKAKDQIRELQVKLEKKKMTPDGRKRKDKIIEKLFFKRKFLQMVLNFYLAVFPQLQKYVLVFQKKEPLIHRMHDEIVDLVKEFLGNFLKPEILSSNPRKLSQIKVEQEQHWLKESHIFIGRETSRILATYHAEDQVRADFMKRVKQAYTSCGQYLLKKMPINNKFLQYASAIDPVLRNSQSTQVLMCLKRLPDMLSTVLEESELNSYDLECRGYILDNKLPPYDAKKSVDEYWALVFEGGNYPLISKIVKAVLSCFHGPQVESSFSMMSNIINPGRSRLKVETYDSLQTVNYQLMASNKTSVDYFRKNDPVHDAIDKNLIRNMRSAYSSYKAEQDEIKQAKEQREKQLDIVKMKALSKKKALEAKQLEEKKARKAHRLKMLTKMVKRRNQANNARYPSLASASVPSSFSVVKGGAGKGHSNVSDNVKASSKKKSTVRSGDKIVGDDKAVSNKKRKITNGISDKALSNTKRKVGNDHHQGISDKALSNTKRKVGNDHHQGKSTKKYRSATAGAGNMHLIA